MSRFDHEELLRAVGSLGHSGMIGIRYRDHGDDWVEMELPYREDLIGDAAIGILASGPILSLMDVVTSLSVMIRQKQRRPQATLDLRVDYLRPAEPGKPVIGRGECYKLTKSVAFVRGEAHDGDPARPLAHVAGTFAFTDG